MAFVPKDWRNATTYAGGGDESTPVTAESLEDLETRVTDYSDQISATVFNVMSYGAAADGSTDDTAAIQDALDAAYAAGGGVVYMPPGTYLVTMNEHPDFAGYYSAARVGGGVSLVGAGMGATTIKLDDGQPTYASANIVQNLSLDASTPDTNLRFADFEIDGNGGNQTEYAQGLAMTRTQGVRVNRVRVKNVFGDAAFPPGETFHFTMTLSTDCFLSECEAIGDAGLQGTGFGDNLATNVSYVSCLARGMSDGFGWASWKGRNNTWVNCYGQQNDAGGFNLEYGEGCSYSNCVAGGRSAPDAGTYPWASADVELGNTVYGFICNASNEIQYSGCQATYGATGIAVVSTGSDHSSATILGGEYSHNSSSGVYFGDTTCARQSRVSKQTYAVDNTTANWNFNGGAGYLDLSLRDILIAPTVVGADTVIPNNYPFDVDIIFTGGGRYYTFIDGNNYGVPDYVRLRAGGSLYMAYGSAPTWIWARA